jgi:hypothetical protein
LYNRKKLDRERLEIYLTQLIMKIRLILLMMGIFIFVYGLATIMNSLISGILISCIGIFFVFLGSSFWMITKTAMFLSWMALVGKKE